MCGRFAVTLPPEAMASLFGSNDIVNYQPNYNVAPTHDTPIVAIGKERNRRIIMARWGLMPQWLEKDPQRGPMFNARAETIDERPTFRQAFAKRRCIVPADGFYEWRRDGDIKTPYFISRKDSAPMAFAGLWEMRKVEGISDKGMSEEIIISTTIITTKASLEFEKIHDRIPVILEPEAWSLWLENQTPVPRLKSLMFPPDNGVIKWHKVSNAVNKVANNDKDLINPI